MKKSRKRIFFTIIALLIASAIASAMGGKTPGPNRASVSMAGSDQAVGPYYQVVLDGRNSSDPEADILIYEWID